MYHLVLYLIIFYLYMVHGSVYYKYYPASLSSVLVVGSVAT